MKRLSQFRSGAARKFWSSLLIVVALVAIQPYLWGWVEATSRLLHDRRTSAQQLQNVETELQKVTVAAQESESIDEQLDIVLIQPDEITQAVERIEQAAENVGINLAVQGIGTTNAAEGEVLQQLVISVLAVGLPERLLTYIDVVEHFPELTSWQEFVMEGDPGEAGDTGATINNYSLAANIVFYMPAQENTEDVEDSEPGTSSRSSFDTAPEPDRSPLFGIGIVVIIGSVLFLAVIIGLRFMRRAKR